MSHLPFRLFTHHTPQELHILCSLTYVPLLIILSPQHKTSFLFLPICQYKHSSDSAQMLLSQEALSQPSCKQQHISFLASLTLSSFTLLIKCTLHASYSIDVVISPQR